MTKVSTDDLARLIAEDLKNYSEEVQDKMESTIDKVAEEALQATKDSSSIKHMDGYKNCFFIKNEYKARGKGKGFYKLKVANKKYQLTHLLEYGHITRNGGRTRTFPHWINGQKVANTLPEKIKEALEK